jgi:thiol:disulfide interchange protein DsbA
MRNTFWISAALLLLAACGSEEPAQPAEQAPAAADQAAAEAPAEAEAPASSEAEEEALQVVEESAAEPEAEEQEQAIMLAQADTAAATRQWKFREGQHYSRMVPTQPTVGGADKIEVAEFFWYGCPHCYDFEPVIDGWDANKPANVRFVRVPAMWNNILQLHARLFYTQEVLARNGTLSDGPAFHQTVFQEFHQRGNRLTSEASIQRLFERFGVSAGDFETAWNSFEVGQKMRVAQDLARRYSIASVPAIVVNGKYRTGGAEAGSYGTLLEVIDELIARESAR